MSETVFILVISSTAWKGGWLISKLTKYLKISNYIYGTLAGFV
jgi:hypothetical protein